MAEAMGTGIDVITFLIGQHEQIKGMFARVRNAAGSEREKQFYALRRLLAVHETAEELVVHPAARRALPNGEEVVQMRLDEENEAKEILGQLESLDVGSNEFDTLFERLEQSVLAHAEAEETEEFEELDVHLDQEQLQRMQRAAELAEKLGPTRPHAGVESALGNLAVGPFASMLDRARDALSGKAAP